MNSELSIEVDIIYTEDGWMKAEVGTIPRIPVFCPNCGSLHEDEGEWANRPHHTHLCLVCRFEWRIEPYVFGASLPEVLEKFLPFFKPPPEPLVWTSTSTSFTREEK